MVAVILITTGIYVVISDEKKQNNDDDNTIDSVENLCVILNWQSENHTNWIDVNISNTGTKSINLTTFWSIYNIKPNIDMAIYAINPINKTLNVNISDVIGDAVVFGQYILLQNASLQNSSWGMGWLQSVYHDDFNISGTYEVYVVLEGKYRSNSIFYNFTAPKPILWHEVTAFAWRDVLFDTNLKQLLANEMGVNSSIVHIYVYRDVPTVYIWCPATQVTSIYDKQIGAVAENHSSMVCWYNSTSHNISVINHYIPNTNGELQAFYILSTGFTNNSEYGSENLVPVNFTTTASNSLGSEVIDMRFFFWKDIGFYEALVNITTNEIKYIY